MRAIPRTRGDRPEPDRDWTHGFDARQLKSIARVRAREKRDRFFFRFFALGGLAGMFMIWLEQCT